MLQAPAEHPMELEDAQSRSEDKSSEDQLTVIAHEDETLKQIGARIGVDPTHLLTLNKDRYKGLTAHAKLQEGTILLVPPGAHLSDEEEDDRCSCV